MRSRKSSQASSSTADSNTSTSDASSYGQSGYGQADDINRDVMCLVYPDGRIMTVDPDTHSA